MPNMDESIKTVQPRTGKNHKMFSSRWLKYHNFRDPRWTVADKVMQYNLLTTLHDKDQKFNTLSRVAETRKRSNQVLVLRQRVKNAREELRLAILGDPVRIQDALNSRKDLQRLFQSMTTEQVVENMKQRTYCKRKELDRMIDRQRRMTEKYEHELLELSRSQDSLKYNSEIPQKDIAMSTKLRLDLKNTETRMTAVRFITQAYQRILNTMVRDSLYFDPVMDALEQDVVEQKSFIETTIRLGRPAIANHMKLIHTFEQLQLQTERDIVPRVETLRQYRMQIEKNNKDIKELVRRDSDFAIFIHRYQRNTNSMTQLKNNVEGVEKIMKGVKFVTSCDKEEEVIPRIKQHMRDRLKLKYEIPPREHERANAQERDVHANVQLQALTHNLTPEEVARGERIKALESDIEAEIKQQTELKTDIRERNIMLCDLKLSFQHTIDVLRHVGQKHVVAQTYLNEDLKLPLLNFAQHIIKSKPPLLQEENIGTILTVVKQRVEALMSKFDENRFKTDRTTSIRKYHDDVLADRRNNELEMAPETTSVPTIYLEDPAVLTRIRLKAISQRIVVENLKKDEFKTK